MRNLKAESYLSILIVISLFSILFLAYRQWQFEQTARFNRLYQQQQALQIAENQISLRQAGRSCENSLKQNELQFTIQCNSTQIEVRYPLGKVVLEYRK